MTVEWKGVAAFAASLERMARNVDLETRYAAEDAGRAVRNMSRARARRFSKTGENADTITIEGPTKTGASSYRVRVGPTKPYSRRLELGFKRADSLGRHYHQRGRHFLSGGFKAAQKRAIPESNERHWRRAIGVR